MVSFKAVAHDWVYLKEESASIWQCRECRALHYTYDHLPPDRFMLIGIADSNGIQRFNCEEYQIWKVISQ